MKFTAFLASVTAITLKSSFISDGLTDLASNGPAIGKLQDKMEKLETLKPAIDSSIKAANEILKPIPQQPEPAPKPAAAVCACVGCCTTSAPAFAEDNDESVSALARKALQNLEGGSSLAEKNKKQEISESVRKWSAVQ